MGPPNHPSRPRRLRAAIEGIIDRDPLPQPRELVNFQSDLYQRLAAKAGFIVEPATSEERMRVALTAECLVAPHKPLAAVFIAACAQRIAERELTTTIEAVKELAQFGPNARHHPQQVAAIAKRV